MFHLGLGVVGIAHLVLGGVGVIHLTLDSVVCLVLDTAGCGLSRFG